MPKACNARSEITAPTTPIQFRATCVPLSTDALLNEGSSGEYEASARNMRSAETHNRNPISSFSRRLPVGTKMPVRRRIYGPSLHGMRNSPVAQIGQSLIIMPRTGRGGNAGICRECTVGFLRGSPPQSGLWGGVAFSRKGEIPYS